MAKTYGTVTTFTAGSVLTAAQLNTAGTAINNLVVPPSVKVARTTSSSYTSGAAYSWSSAVYDTDGMFSAGSPTVLTVNTAGIYVITFSAGFSFTGTVTLPEFQLNAGGNSVATDYRGGSYTNYVFATMTATVPLSVGQTISANIYFTGGSAYAYVGDARSNMTATWIGRTS